MLHIDKTDFFTLGDKIVECADPIFQQKQATYSIKKDASFVSETDIALDNAIKPLLTDCYDCPIVSEEDAIHCTQHDEYWVIDPLDGTTNFIHGFPAYSVSIALIKNHQSIAGLVYDPNAKELFSAIRNQGAWLNKTPLTCQPAPNAQEKPWIGLVEYKSLTIEQNDALRIHKIFKSQRCIGTVALEICYVAASRVQAYLAGPKRLWDYSAGHLIAEEAGGICSTLDNQPLIPYTLQPKSLCICTDRFAHQRILSALNS